MASPDLGGVTEDAQGYRIDRFPDGRAAMVGTPADPSGLLDVLGEPVTLPGSSVALEVVRAADGLPARLYDGSPTPHTRVWGNAEGPWPLAGDSEGAHWMWVGIEGMMVSRLEGATAAVDAMTDPLSGSLVLLGEDLLDAPGAWGTDLDVPAGRTARFVYAGQEVLPQTPYMLAGHRLYDPQLGRFLSADPLGLEGGPHRFTYADSRPTDRVDPRGLSALGWSGGVASTGVWQPPGGGGCGPRCWNVEQSDGGGTSAGSNGASPRGGRGPLTIDDEKWEDDGVCEEDLACDFGFTPDSPASTEQDEGKGGASGGTRGGSGGGGGGGAGGPRLADPAMDGFRQDARALEEAQDAMTLREQAEGDLASSEPHGDADTRPGWGQRVRVAWDTRLDVGVSYARQAWDRATDPRTYLPRPDIDGLAQTFWSGPGLPLLIYDPRRSVVFRVQEILSGDPTVAREGWQEADRAVMENLDAAGKMAPMLGGAGQCFTGDAEVACERGWVPIAQVQVGERCLARDVAAPRPPAASPRVASSESSLRRRFERWVQQVLLPVLVTLWGPSPAVADGAGVDGPSPATRVELLAIDGGQGEVALAEVTEGQRFVLEGRVHRRHDGQVEPTGDVLAPVTATFRRQVPSVIDAVVAYPDGAHDQVAATANHPFWAPDRAGWVYLAALEVGSPLHVQGGGRALLVSKTWRQGDFTVFDLEIQGLHSFYVRGVSGGDGVLVHNSVASEGAVLRKYGGPGGGHHVPAKSAFRDAPGYNMNEALAIPNAELARLGVSHPAVTAGQMQGYRAFSATGQSLTWDAVSTIETNALVRGGMSREMASSTVQQAITSLQQAGVAGPTRIPWGP